MTDLVKEEQNVTDKQSFIPIANQMKWLDTAVELESDTITDISEACHIQRMEWYRWLKQEGFIEWFNGEWNNRLKAHTWKLDTIGLKRAKNDHRYWESMQKRVGNIKDPGVQVNTQINNFIPILGGATKEE